MANIPKNTVAQGDNTSLDKLIYKSLYCDYTSSSSLSLSVCMSSYLHSTPSDYKIRTVISIYFYSRGHSHCEQTQAWANLKLNL